MGPLTKLKKDIVEACGYEYGTTIEPIAFLRNYINSLKQEIAQLEVSAAMACENPCGNCAGCLYAEEQYGDKSSESED